MPVAHLRAQLGISPATLSREMHAARSEVLRLGSGRATHYGLAAGYRGLPSRLPVFRIGASGSTATVAELVLLSGGSWLQPTSGGGSRFDGLPPFIQDMAPAGYLGRHFARYHADLALPDRLQDWHDRHRLLAIARRGSDCPGDLVVGEQAMDRYLGESKGVYGLDDFPELAQRAGVGSAGSSAAGEQPKFAYFDGHRHLLVKFTPGDDSPTDQRWRDLLVCEALASETLTEHGITAAATEVIDLENRRYLQVERFDRTRAGRVGVLSLGALVAEVAIAIADRCRKRFH
ncbi:MAG: HipA domain-containing protein [Pseudomonadota bacterium]